MKSVQRIMASITGKNTGLEQSITQTIFQSYFTEWEQKMGINHEKIMLEYAQKNYTQKWMARMIRTLHDDFDMEIDNDGDLCKLSYYEKRYWAASIEMENLFEELWATGFFEDEYNALMFRVRSRVKK